MLDNGTRPDSVTAVGLVRPGGPGRWLYLLSGAIFTCGLALGVVLAIQAAASVATLVVRRITRWQLQKSLMMLSPLSAGSPAQSRLP